ncbi:outer membrane protein transport protein [Thalassotalea aquiviva]|uniref:outer membrane protein transport protein n=1 Tax=Thalassotalea aquiviva TaxID=3242415 RepID=UPI00352A289B
MTFQKSLLTLALGLACANVNAAGFQLHETSVSGLGRAFAGDAVIADDASVFARNPAAMALFDKKSLSVGATYVDPGVDVKGTGAPDLVLMNPNFDVSSLDQNGVVPAALIPSAYFINPVDEKFAWGVGLNVNYGLASKYDSDYAAGSIAGETDLFSLNINLGGSYRINEQLSVGAGINLVYADAMLNRNTGAILVNGLPSVLPAMPADTTLMHIEGDDTGFGWNVGVVYELNENHRFGLTYRSAVEITFEGELTDLVGNKSNGSLAMDMPAFAEFSGFHQLTNDWAVHYSVMHTDWDSFEELSAFVDGSDVPAFYKVENFESTLRTALGVTYNFDEKLTLRAGIAFDESAAQQGNRSVSIPDSDRLWYSAGATYVLDASSTIDFGLAYVNGEKVEVVEHDAILETAIRANPAVAPLLGNTNWSFESEGNAILVGFQYNRQF